MIWPFGIIDAQCIEQFGTIGQMREKEEELPLKEIFQNKRIDNENIRPYS
jgi:hypothetical protein